MLRQLARTLVMAVALIVVFGGSSALGARSTRPATTPAPDPGHKCKSARRSSRKPGAVVHCGKPGKADVASTGVLLGDSSVEGQYDALIPGQAEAFRLQAPTTGVAALAHIYISAKNAANTVIVGLYSDAHGRPGSLLSTGSAPASKANTWTAVSVAPFDLTAGQTYWLAILGTGGTLRYRDRWQGTCPSDMSAQVGLATLPAYFRVGRSYTDCPPSVYLTSVSAPSTEDPLDLDATLPANALAEETPAPEAPPPSPGTPVNVSPPTIAGTATEGEVLSASSGTWTEAPTSYAYQWQDCNTSGEACANVSGATSSDYTLRADDVGHTLRVAVTASNAGGSSQASSDATATVASSPPQAPTNTVLPSMSGSAVEGQTLSASSGTWSGSPTSFAYQWEDCSTAGEACANIGGATSSSYKLASGDVGHTLRVVVTASNAGGSTNASSAATGTVVPPAPVNTVLPSVSGSAVEGQSLAASSGTWSGSPTSFAYQWEDCNTSGGACVNISGATSSSYELRSGDVGHALRVVVTASNPGGSTKAFSAATGTVVPLPPTNTVPPSVTGSAVEGQTLSASSGTWSGSPTSFAYQWEDCNTSGESCSNISGATSSGYKLAAGDVGHTLRVAVTATNAGGATTVSSAATTAVVPLAPANTARPSVSGAAVEGQTLSASTGTWSGSPTSFAYQWEDCSTAGEACANIGGATSSGYKLASGDVAHTLRVVVTASNAGGSAKASSAATGTVVPPAPANTVLPSVSGAAVEGQTLSASSGTWSGSPTSFAYQWEDCNTAGEACANIGGATASSYKLVSGDVGHTLRVAVTASNAGGSTKASSAASGTVAPPAPVNTALPSVTGSAVEGQTLAASSGTWSGSPTSFAYQWEDCNTAGEACANIGGATSSSYKLASGDVGHTLRVAVTASNAGGSAKASSTATGTVVPPAPANTVLPSVSGSAVEGQTLSASTGTWSGSPTSYAYQWEDCDTAGEACANIGGATSSSYKLGSGDVGHTLRVVVTASNAGGSARASSAATGTIVPLPPANTALPSVSGSAVEGQSLGASSGTWSGSPTSFAYQWQDCNTSGEACSNIGGATSLTYKLTAGDVGSTVRVVVTASNAGGSTQASATATAVVTSALPPANTALPSVNGSAVEGQTLSASTGTWSGSPTSFAYQWEDCNTAGEACSNIGGATSSNYKLVAGDVGHTLRVAVTATNPNGSTKASSTATAPVTPLPPANTALPSVSGSTVEGQTLSASAGTWSGSPSSFAYRWQDCDGSGEACSNIAGATSSSYTLQATDVEHTLRVVVTASNAGGSTQASSAATATVTANSPPPPPAAPTNIVAPSVSGATVEGETLTASNGTWTESPSSYTYQWQDCDPLGEGCLDVSGATSSTYRLTAGDVGSTVRVLVTASNAGGSTQAGSAATTTVTSAPPPPSPPTNTALPSVSGSAVEGQTLSASTGTWLGSPTSYAYQWEDCNTAGEVCANIGGATSSSYQLGVGRCGPHGPCCRHGQQRGGLDTGQLGGDWDGRAACSGEHGAAVGERSG